MILGCLLQVSCCHHHLSILQQTIDPNYLASVNVKTPDPRQKNPPFGQQLIIEWWVPKLTVVEGSELVLHVIYWDYSQETCRFPIKKRGGYHLFPLLREKFEEKKGFLTYMAEIVDKEGRVYAEWKHQLWVNLITFDEENLEELGDEHSPLFTPEDIEEPAYDDDDETEEPQFEPSPELTWEEP
jgi:hypothetical protein